MFETRQTAMFGRRCAIWLAALLAAVISCALLAGSANAGTYSVYSCTGPAQESLPNYAWFQARSPAHTSAVGFGSNCPDLSVVTTPGTTLAAGENAGYAFLAPAGTSIYRYDIRRSISIAFPTSGTRPTLSAGLRRTTGAVDTYSLECDKRTTDCNVPASGTQSVGTAAQGLQLGVECAQATSCAGSGFSTLRSTLISARVDLADNSAPAVTRTGGSLQGTIAASGERSLDVQISDLGGGVKSYWLSIDGVRTAIENVGGSCSGVYVQPVPCPTERVVSYSVNPAAYGPGPHTAVVAATDAADNVGTMAPVSFTVPGGVLANGSPSVEVPKLTTAKSLVSVKSTRSVAVRGVLRTSTGRGIGGATLEVNSSSLGTASAVPGRTGSVRTSADGSFSYKVKPNGALRITFTFRPASGAPGTATASTTLRQAIALSARRSQAQLRRGASLTVSGRLSGAGRAAAGAPVEIQVKNGKSWSTVDTVAAGKSGSYRWTYRFKRVTRPTLFTFRAIVRSRPDWPWSSRTSSPVRVLVLG